MSRIALEPGQLEGDIAAILGLETGRGSRAAPARGRLSGWRSVGLASALVIGLIAAASAILPLARSLYDRAADPEATAAMGEPVVIRAPVASPAPDRQRVPIDAPTPAPPAWRAVAARGESGKRAEPVIARAAPTKADVAPRRSAVASTMERRSSPAAAVAPPRRTSEARTADSPSGTSTEATAARPSEAPAPPTAMAARDPAPATAGAAAAPASTSAAQENATVADPAPAANGRSAEKTQTQRSIDAIRLLRRQ